MMLKILIGFIFSSTIIFSIFQLGLLYQGWLKQFEDSHIIGVVSYSVLAILCSLTLYFLFSEYPFSSPHKPRSLPTEQTKDQSPEHFALKFAEGFIEGLERH